MHVLEFFNKHRDTIIVSLGVILLLVCVILFMNKEKFDYDTMEQAYGEVPVNVKIVYKPGMLSPTQIGSFPFAMLLAITNIQNKLHKRAIIDIFPIGNDDTVVPDGYTGVVVVDSEAFPIGETERLFIHDLIDIHKRLDDSRVTTNLDLSSLPKIQFVINTEKLDEIDLARLLAVSVNSIQTKLRGQIILSGSHATNTLAPPRGYMGVLNVYIPSTHSTLTIPFGKSQTTFGQELIDLHHQIN